MESAIIAMEALSIVVLLIVLYGSIFEIKMNNKKNRIFVAYIAVSVACLLIDILAWILNGKHGINWLLFILNLSLFYFGYSMAFGFHFYILAILGEKKKCKITIKKSSIIFLLVNLVVVTILAIFGKIFVISHGVYHMGKWYIFSQFYTITMMIYNLIIIVRNSKILGKHDTAVLASYIFFPVFTIIIHFFNHELSLSYIVVAMCQLMLYVLMQAEQVTNFRDREMVLMKETHTDVLTKLQNRRAFEELCEEVHKKMYDSNDIAVAFCDLNGLKNVNDSKGHEAGDEYIKKFAVMLQKNFRYDEIYRISGDEFVIVMTEITKSMYKKRIRSFRMRINEKNMPIASIGTAYGENYNIRGLVKLAEGRMYLEKEKFYKKYPEMRR